MTGYYVRDISIICITYICQICGLILRNPVQLLCGHRQCKLCVESKEGNSIECPECGEKSDKKEVLPDRGFKNDMQTVNVECFLCDWTGLLKNYEEHLQQTHPSPSCQYCGDKFNTADQLGLHVFNQCKRVPVRCPLKDFGCTATVMREQMSSHYKSEQHQTSITAFIRRYMPKVTHQHHEQGSTMDVDTTLHTHMHPLMNSVQFQEAYETVVILMDGVDILREDSQRLSQESICIQNAIETFNQSINELKSSLQEQSTYLNGIKPNQEILSQEITSLTTKVEEKQSVSYDGTYIWKITNVGSKMADAESERQTSIYSPPFYSSPTGYKMRVRLYFNGDGNARRTHISLFFVLMRSEYDAILKFPFHYKVTFCLYDQNSTQKHIVDSFRPDTKSNSFQRPRSEMNIASGIPTFCPLTTIRQEGNGYIRDDTMFIKVMVDFGDMPKLILPYFLNLSPALPINIQQTLAKQELERRTQQNSSQTLVGTPTP